jgi:ribosomal protein S18 acetylase RimI-like enzyme
VGADEALSHSHRIKGITCADKEAMNTVADLHIELLGFGPMAALGQRFIREACYVNNMVDGQLQVAVYEVDGVIGGFVAFTDRSISFHRTSLRKHWLKTAFTLLLSLLADPRRLAALWRAFAVLGARRSEHETVGTDPMGEVVCIAVQPKYLKAEFRTKSGSRPGQELVVHAARCLRDLGVSEMRMLVDADNKAVLFLYRALGARFESYQQAGEPIVQVWFDLEKLLQVHGGD